MEGDLTKNQLFSGKGNGWRNIQNTCKPYQKSNRKLILMLVE